MEQPTAPARAGQSVQRRRMPVIQSVSEEIASTVTHGIGAVFAVAALVILVVLSARWGDAWRVVSLSIYGSTMVLLYLASTLYHAFRSPRLKRFFWILDHVSIYLLIAGTYTPIVLVPLRGAWGWTLFGLIWGLAATGILIKLFWIGRLGVVSVAVYIGMGWLVLIALRPVLTLTPPGLVAWMGAGGVFYTLGVAFYAWTSVRYHHAVWHLFVLAGSVCHFVGMARYVATLPR